jgi:periplasmic glucans biosynthesis protein
MPRSTRRLVAQLLVNAAALLAVLIGCTDAIAARAFGFDDVAERARVLASSPYRPAGAALPPALAALDYDGRRELRHRPERARWRDEGLPFDLMFFHRAGAQSDAVRLHSVEGGRVRALRYDAADWDFGRLPLDAREFAAAGDLGHAGFRIHHELNRPGVRDELVVFLGASYFRALGRGQVYGLSARGLAIDTVDAPAGRGEEFPRFTDFWVHKPMARDEAIVVHALLDSPRAPVAMLGLAPLSSMYQHGENQPWHPAQRRGHGGHPEPDFRPEVHDSDGLLVAAQGSDGGTEWLWRPLVNPPQPLASSFQAQRLQGFGLLQRDRRFTAYEDTEARYEKRPGAWVEPLGDWGPGRVLLLQLPTPDETEDNIVAAWVPARAPAPGEPLDFAYRLHWQGDAQQAPPLAHTVQTRRGRSWGEPAPGELKFIVDFAGGPLAAPGALPADARAEPVVTALANARVLHADAWPHPEAGPGGWRMAVRVQRVDPARPLELRAFLRHGERALTETWTALVPQE